jgi:hypothetical protein
MTMRKCVRILAVVTAGGMVVQAGGCATTLGPIALSLFENLVLSSLFGGIGI